MTYDPNTAAGNLPDTSAKEESPDYGIRSAAVGDLAAISRVHQNAFAGFFLSKLGIPVLVEYYRCILDSDSGILLVCVLDDQVHGFVAGFGKPPGFYRALARRGLRVLFPVVRSAVTQPQLILRLFQNVRTLFLRRKPASPRDEHKCYLSSLAVCPSASGRGMGTSLVRAFIGRAREMNSTVVYLHTDADRNESVNRFYRRLGFTLANTFTASGARMMNEYTYVIRPEVEVGSVPQSAIHQSTP